MKFKSSNVLKNTGFNDSKKHSFLIDHTLIEALQ